MSGSGISFSHHTREQNIERLQEEHWDMLVIGGGITGVSIARDAAMRGFRTALLDKGDFASGTSSRSSRMAHGGIRYLEQMDFPLVFEALRERNILRDITPHMVRPVPTLYPVYRNRQPSLPMLAAGMWLYDVLALFRNVRLHRLASARTMQGWEPHLKEEGLQGGAEYYDALAPDARLTLAVARAAHRSDAVLVTYAEVSDFMKENGHIVGAQVEDRLTSDRQWDLRARVIINATGIWADHLMQMDEPAGERHMRLSKGVHIVVPRERFQNQRVVIFFSPRDGRILFLIPWGRQTVIGTTDTDCEGDLDEVHATKEDVDYILEAVKAAFPHVDLSEADIISTFAGLRPLVIQPGAASAYQVSREHQIFSSPSGLVTISGGKLTTAREMARQVTDVAERRLRQQGVFPIAPCRTHLEPLDPAPLSELRRLVDGNGQGNTLAGPSPELVEHLIERYGSEYRDILTWMIQYPSLAAPMVEGLPYRWAEIRYALAREMALTLPDMLVRRIPLMHETPEQGLEVAQEVAARMAEALGWSDNEREVQLCSYRNEVLLSRLYKQDANSVTGVV